MLAEKLVDFQPIYFMVVCFKYTQKSPKNVVSVHQQLKCKQHNHFPQIVNLASESTGSAETSKDDFTHFRFKNTEYTDHCFDAYHYSK